MTTGRAAALAAALLLLAACASPVRTTELAHIDQFAGYRYTTLEKKAPKTIDKAAVILTFSGGGTRAAALADGALRAMAETPVKAGETMLPFASQIDLVSSVSGGSVTAAYFALGGIDGLDSLESDFLESDVMSKLIWSTLLDPARLLYPRIDILEGYLDEKVFHKKTYADLIAVDQPGRNRRPYVLLNAADMSSGSVFSFNQDQFDLICADLSQLKIADAVAASAAFPVALSALTIRNRAPCAAQRQAPATPGTGWASSPAGPLPKRLANDIAAETDAGVSYPAAENLARFRRGTVALGYLNRDGKADYIQLLDGGIADNMGLTVPLTLLTSPGESPSFLNWANTGKADKLLLLVVNARSQSENDYGTRPRPPGAFNTLLTTIGTPIDATSFQLLGKIDAVVDGPYDPKALVMVGFDFIADPGCRAHFQGMATSWTLPRDQVRELIALGKAMVLQSPDYKVIVTALGGSVPPANPSVEQICRPYGAKPS
jgi:NTE family protein